MADSLAQSLVDAAASAICHKGDPHCSDGLVPAMVEREAREATAAVLEMLAAHGWDISDPDAWLSEHDRLLKLVAEIRESPCP
jgi:hypothetical protein